VTRAVRWPSFLIGVLCGVVLAGVGSAARAADADLAYKKLRIFSQVLTYVQTSYVDDVDPQRLIYDAIGGMLSRLDPHTQFLPADEYEKLREDTAGEFGGLGIDVGAVGEGKDALIAIEAVRPDGPGAHAGLKAGDLIVAVDGTSIRGEPLEVGVRLMRGVPGTRVVLTVSRAQWSRPRDIPLVRRHVRVGSVEHDVLEAPGVPVIGYVAISTFQERTDQELGAALADIRREVRKRGGTQPGA
jgi:carboxyl-terminal processing protease